MNWRFFTRSSRMERRRGDIVITPGARPAVILSCHPSPTPTGTSSRTLGLGAYHSYQPPSLLFGDCHGLFTCLVPLGTVALWHKITVVEVDDGGNFLKNNE